MRKGRDREKNKKKKKTEKTGKKEKKIRMKIVATMSLPAVDRPNADRWNAARSHQNFRVSSFFPWLTFKKFYPKFDCPEPAFDHSVNIYRFICVTDHWLPLVTIGYHLGPFGTITYNLVSLRTIWYYWVPLPLGTIGYLWVPLVTIG